MAATEVGPVCPTSFCLVYHLAPEATWSDGAPVTAADLKATANLHRFAGTGGESGYDLIESVEVVDERTAMVVFSRLHGAWGSLFSRVFRSGHAAGDVTEIDTTGPFQLVEWARGEHVLLQRDPDWWAQTDPMSGSPVGQAQQIEFVFIDDPEELTDALEDGEVDVISLRADTDTIEALSDIEGVRFTTSPGSFWEHLDFNHADPLLSQRWIREVFAHAIDRQKLLDRTVRLIDPEATALDNTVWMTGTKHYRQNFMDRHDPVRAGQMLADHGCGVGEDGIQVCDGQRLSFVWASTDDDPARREAFDSVREDLAAVGIEVIGDFRSPSSFVTRDFLFGDTWQLINFSWRARPEPMAANPVYYCDDAEGLNVNRYCSAAVADLVRSTDSIVDPGRRAEAYNRADSLYLEDLALIPLYQKLNLLAWTAELSGPVPNNSLSTDLWNVAGWSGKDSIVVALPAEPLEIDPLSTSDDNANVIMAPLMYGAFGMSPTQETIPVLVDTVDVLLRGN
ncbi:MAG TPA: ABC transporter substrate-binding protein [Acidimicrobiia bacterium]|nr:ABC transporter substrate-binding protein [Acidimicrobiia bacterium]